MQGNIAWQYIDIHPDARATVNAGVTQVQSSIQTIKGIISVAWEALPPSKQFVFSSSSFSSIPSDSAAALFVLSTTVPFGSTATITIPFVQPSQTGSNVQVFEGDYAAGTATAVWKNGAFVPSAVAGVSAGTLQPDGIAFVAGGGSYAFTLVM